MVFWIVAGTLGAMVTGLMALALLRRDEAESSASSADQVDIQIYRDQLAAVDRDLARGVVTQEDSERLRTEIKRRILDADRAASGLTPTGSAPRTASLAALAASAFVIIGGSLWLYDAIGAPNYPDLPLAGRLEAAAEARASRPSQAEVAATLPAAPDPDVSAEYLDLVNRLRSAVAERPDDLQGQELLARTEGQLGNFTAAAEAQARILEIKGEDATAADYANYGDILVLAAGGYVSPEAESAFEAALARDGSNGTARYYVGLMHLQTGRPDLAFRVWQAQLQAGPPDAPWIAPIRAQIEGAARRAGVDYQLPEATAPALAGPGPSAADMEAAEAMSPTERLEMIQGMVSGLSERLATEGGPPEDWARLIRAYGVLGRRDAAAAIWSEAQVVFEDEAVRLPILRAARDAGVAQ